MADTSKIERFGPALPALQSRRLEVLGSPSPIEEADEGTPLRAYWTVLRSRRWTALSALLVILTVVAIYTARQKPIYRAKSLVEIEQENPNVVTLQQVFQLQNVSADYLNTQYKILQSDNLARQVIGKLRLDRAAEFSPSRGSAKVQDASADPPAEADAAREQSVLARFKGRLSIDPVPQSRLVAVAFDSQDPRLAARVVNALVAAYIQQNLDAHWEASQQASAWLSQQLDDMKIKLEKSEDDLQNYAQANGLLFVDNSQGGQESIVNQRLQQLQKELTQAQSDLYQKEPLDHLVQAGEYGALPGIFDNPTMQQLTVQLAGLERQKAELAATFDPSYPKMKEIQSQIDRIQQFLGQQQQQAARHVQDEYLAALRRAELVRQAFREQQAQANLVAQKSVEYNILKREADTNRQLYEGLLQRVKEAGVSAGLKASNIRVVDSAVPPVGPVKPRVLLNLGVGLLAGLVCGASLAFLQEHMDNTVKTPDDIENFLRVPALALIPSTRAPGLPKNGQGRSLAGASGTLPAAAKESRNGWLRVDKDSFQQSPVSEAFRSLRTSVLLSTATRPPRSLVFVSAEPSEGKTTVCNNLAISLAQLGKRVLVVDADMRRPTIHNFYHLSNASGLVNCLTGDSEWPSLVQPSGLERLDCLVCGPIPPNPSELLSSDRMRELIAEASTEYDLVLVDAPPLLNVADGRILCTMVEGTILVVKGGSTPREMVRRAELYVSDVGGRLIGVVLNNIDLRREGYYYSSAYGYYGRPASGEEESKASA